ncbi:Hypothetical predicted protein [Pelobates cultripes]|uniref:Uncharacterized protein n=1 Tax=Pelobates cultripes TaxID=61616 RepID=A0AAD1TH38_PELCU|nr:Hypothetical predicted protein [Pelobates cultripes]
MAAKRMPQKQNTQAQPTTDPLGNFDQLCVRLWSMLSERGMAYRWEVNLVATWIRPATRRRHYRHPLQTPRKTTRPYKHRRAQGRETMPYCDGTHTQENKIAKPTSHTSYSPAQRVSPSPLQVTAANQGATQLNTLLDTAGAEPQCRNTFWETNTDNRRHVHALGIC